jgi:hypothetical protein
MEYRRNRLIWDGWDLNVRDRLIPKQRLSDKQSTGYVYDVRMRGAPTSKLGKGGTGGSRGGERGGVLTNTDCKEEQAKNIAQATGTVD